MIKNGILNPDLNRILAESGHTDLITVTDKGFPIPANSERIDLALINDIPKIIDVVEAISKQFVIEKIYIAEEMISVSPAYYKLLKQQFSEYEIECISHIYFKEISLESRAFIKTGDTIPYGNMIIVSG